MSAQASALAKKFLLGSPFPMIGLWLLGGLLTVVIPVTKYKNASNNYYNYQGKAVEYENAQRAYEEAQKAYEEGQNGNYNNNNQNNYMYSMSDCKWWQTKCKKAAYYYWLAQEGGNGDGYTEALPDWYISLGGKMGEEMDREREEQGLSNDEASGALKFVYGFGIVMFVALLAFGSFTMYKKTSPVTFFTVMGVFGVNALLQLVLITQGVIASDDRELENSIYGWYGQLGVLMVYTNYGYFLFSIIFAAIFGIKAFVEYKIGGAETPAETEKSASIAAKDLDESPTDEGNYKSMA